MDRSHLAVAFLLGVCVALGVALVVQSGNAIAPAYAQGGAGDLIVESGRGTQGQGPRMRVPSQGRHGQHALDWTARNSSRKPLLRTGQRSHSPIGLSGTEPRSKGR